MKKRKKILLVLGALFIVLLSTIGFYLGTYYHASSQALEVAEKDAQEVQMNNCSVLLFTGEVDTKSISEKPVFIFYPGGKVQMEAYAPLCSELADKGIICALVKMPCNLAVFKPSAAQDVMDYMTEQYNCKTYYIGGHSLGGVMASYYAQKHADKLKGVIYLASYSSKDLSSTSLKALSIYGSQDKVLDRDSYQEALSNMPKDFREEVIDGGCHSYFGSYGKQKGDGTPTISRKEQLSKTVEMIDSWIQEN